MCSESVDDGELVYSQCVRSVLEKSVQMTIAIKKMTIANILSIDEGDIMARYGDKMTSKFST